MAACNLAGYCTVELSYRGHCCCYDNLKPLMGWRCHQQQMARLGMYSIFTLFPLLLFSHSFSTSSPQSHFPPSAPYLHPIPSPSLPSHPPSLPLSPSCLPSLLSPLPLSLLFSLPPSLPSHSPFLPPHPPSLFRMPQNRVTMLCLMATVGWTPQTSQPPT